MPAIWRIGYMGAGLAVAGTLSMALNFSPFLYFRF
jgi:transketolase C-terminal domain/subunit